MSPGKKKSREDREAERKEKLQRFERLMEALWGDEVGPETAARMIAMNFTMVASLGGRKNAEAGLARVFGMKGKLLTGMEMFESTAKSKSELIANLLITDDLDS